MRAIRQNLFLATVLAFAMTSSGCALLGGLLGGGGLGGLMGLTGEDPDVQSGLSLTNGEGSRIKNGYQIRATGSLPGAGQEESAFYGTYHSR